MSTGIWYEDENQADLLMKTVITCYGITETDPAYSFYRVSGDNYELLVRGNWGSKTAERFPRYYLRIENAIYEFSVENKYILQRYEELFRKMNLPSELLDYARYGVGVKTEAALKTSGRAA